MPNAYFASNNGQGWLVFLYRVLMPETGQAPTFVPSSWGIYDRDDSGVREADLCRPPDEYSVTVRRIDPAAVTAA